MSSPPSFRMYLLVLHSDTRGRSEGSRFGEAGKEPKIPN